MDIKGSGVHTETELSKWPFSICANMLHSGPSPKRTEMDTVSGRSALVLALEQKKRNVSSGLSPFYQ